MTIAPNWSLRMWPAAIGAHWPPLASQHALALRLSTRAVQLRLQHHLRSRRLRAGDVRGGLDCITDMLRFAPEEAPLWREAALLHQQLDEVSAALRSYERFLALVPDGSAAERARAAMDALRSRLN